jgi:hypothetical protein
MASNEFLTAAKSCRVLPGEAMDSPISGLKAPRLQIFVSSPLGVGEPILDTVKLFIDRIIIEQPSMNPKVAHLASRAFSEIVPIGAHDKAGTDMSIMVWAI